MIQSPTALAQTKEQNEALLTVAKDLLIEQDYTAIISKSEQQIPLLTDKALQAEWAMLRAISFGRLDGLAAYKEALTFLVQTYPKTESAAEAKAHLDGVEVYQDIAPQETEKSKKVFGRPPHAHTQTA